MGHTLKIDAAFPGGNIVLDRIDGDTIRLHQDLRDTAGHWFYWYFRITGAAGRTLRFDFNDKNVIGVHGPAISHDHGQTWRWLGTGCAHDTGFTHAFAADENDVRLAMGVPYMQSDLNRWLAKHSLNNRLSIETLCLSRREQAVPLLRISPTGEARHHVLLTCRHHGCEAMASFTLEGLLDAMLADDATGQWFAENVMTLAVPMMDYDGVQAGDQGKNRQPHDHNRDYLDEPLYPEVRAVQERVRLLTTGEHVPPLIDFDLHCPWLRGKETNQLVYLVGSDDPTMWAAQQRFGAMLEKLQQGPMRYAAGDNLPFGRSWNTAANESGLVSHTQWMMRQPGVRLATSIEIPYADVKGRAIVPDDARMLGRDLAAAIRKFLATNPADIA